MMSLPVIKGYEMLSIPLTKNLLLVLTWLIPLKKKKKNLLSLITTRQKFNLALLFRNYMEESYMVLLDVSNYFLNFCQL